MEITLVQALEKGIEAHKAGRTNDAARYYNAILKAQPKHPDANHNIGILAIGLGKIQEALPFFKTALEANSNMVQYWLSYIDALVRLELVNEAKTVLAQAKEKNINFDSLNMIEDRIKNLEQKAGPNEDPPQEQLDYLLNLYNQGELEEAFNEASKLLKEFSHSSILYNIIGTANQAFGKLEEAIMAYKQALRIKPDNEEVYNNLGNTLKGQSKLDEAIVAYKKAISINPKSAIAFNNLGNAVKSQYNLDEALVAYRKAISINPHCAEIYYNLGIALQEQSKLEEAVEAFNEALRIKPDYAEASSNLGECMIKLGSLDEGKSLIRKADGSISL